jgi:hypothetical protein
MMVIGGLLKAFLLRPNAAEDRRVEGALPLGLTSEASETTKSITAGDEPVHEGKFKAAERALEAAAALKLSLAIRDGQS